MIDSVTVADKLDKETILVIIDPLKDQPGALLPILHSIQKSLGYVPDMVIPIIADELNISRADVHGVITFYHYFRKDKPGKHVIQVCRAESCQAMGSMALEQHVKDTLKIDFHATSSDGEFSLEPVYCLGNCACSPSIAIDDKVVGDMDAKKFNELLQNLRTKPEWIGAL